MSDDPFAVLETDPPRLASERAAQIVEERYGLAGELAPLPGERDTNFRVTSAEGEFVFKLANSAEPAGVTEFQNRALMHVADVDPGCPVPRVVPTRRGEALFPVAGDDGRAHSARMLSWLQGVPLQHTARDAAVAHSLGRALARLAAALDGFEHACSNSSHLWDLKRAGHLAELLRHVADPEMAGICRRVLAAFESRIEPRLPALRWQVIYNDLNPSNVLVDPEAPGSVLGIIDFGDIVYSPLVADVAVACAYLVGTGDNALDDVEQFLRGYTSRRPLTGAEVGVLYGLLQVRLVTTILITHWRAARYPENRDYILRNEQRARGILLSMQDEAASTCPERVADACEVAE